MSADKKLIAAITKYLCRYPTVRKAMLFGSRARGDNTERSDYDIAVYGDLPSADKLRIRRAFREELPTLHKIDLVFMQDLSDPSFIKSIQTEGVIIYDAKDPNEAH